MRWLITLCHLLRKEFFPNWMKSLSSVLQIAVALVGALGLFFGIFDLQARFASAADPLFHSYLWTTFIASVVFVALAAVLVQRLLRLHAATALVVTIHTRALAIQHRMAETVRLAAVQGRDYDMAQGLERILGSELREYLRVRLGNRKYYCTVKIILPQEDEGSAYNLKDVFRDAEQDAKTRPRRNIESTNDNYLYQRFKNSGVSDSKQIYIPDITSSQSFGLLLARAQTRDYRSILALPINHPAPQLSSNESDVSGGTGIKTLVGFIGLDSPDPHAFDGLFEYSRKSEENEENRGVDGVYKPLEEMNLLYGITDSVATILILSQSTLADEKKTEDDRCES